MESLITLGDKLEGSDLIIYVVILLQFGLNFYLLKFVVKAVYDISKQLATITEQFRILVQAAFNNRTNNGKRID
jgi:hypothetical protein